MKRFFFCIVVILTIAGVSNTSGQSHPTKQSWEKITEKAIIYLQFGKDLSEMGRVVNAQMKDIKDIGEAQSVFDLCKLASQAADYFEAVSDITFMYDMMDSPRDKVKVKKFVNKRLDNYIQSFESIIREVNFSLTHITNAGIVATGTRLRDELRDGQSLLRAAKVR